MLSGLGGVLQSLSIEQQRQRQQALQEAARVPVGRTVSWNSPPPANDRARSGAAGQGSTRATYVNKGAATNDRGQKCTKVEETITLPDGKTGTSEQLVCGS